MANELTLKRLREKVNETIGTQKNLGGAAFVVIRNNGSVLSGKTGTFEFDLEDALEVHEACFSPSMSKSGSARMGDRTIPHKNHRNELRPRFFAIGIGR